MGARPTEALFGPPPSTQTHPLISEITAVENVAAKTFPFPSLTHTSEHSPLSVYNCKTAYSRSLIIILDNTRSFERNSFALDFV